MSTYSFNTFCPRCGNPAYAEGHTRLPEEILSCRFCGYSAGSKVDREKLVEGQPPPEPEKFECRAAGAWFIKRRSGGGQWGHLEVPLDWKKTISRFQEILRDPDVDPNESYLTKWDEENRRVVILAGSPKLRIGGDECPLDCPENCSERDPNEWPELCPKGFVLK